MLNKTIFNPHNNLFPEDSYGNSGEKNKSCSFNALLRLILLESVLFTK